jgi:hypothetical protein
MTRGWVMLCAVCTVHKEMRSASFLVQPQNQGQRFLPFLPQNRWLRFLWFGLKTTHLGFRFEPQNRQLRYGDLAHKITTMVS